MFLLLLQTASALPVISVPLDPHAPPAGSTMVVLTRPPLFASATKPWVSDFARVTCTSEKGWIAAVYDLAGEPATSLPERVTCTQGGATVQFGLRFVAPEPDAWMTDEGVFILPVPGPRGAWAMHSLRLVASPWTVTLTSGRSTRSRGCSPTRTTTKSSSERACAVP